MKNTSKEQQVKPSKNLIKQLHTAVDSRNATETQKLILRLDVSDLEKMSYFPQMFVSKFSNNDTFIATIFRTILEKIDTESKPIEFLQQLKADSLFYRAQAIIKSFAEESAEVKIFHLTPSLLACERANAIYFNNIEASPGNIKFNNAINSFIDYTISTHPDLTEAFALAKQSLEYRQQHLESNNTTILAALIAIATIGAKLETPSKIQALAYAEEAYNMATELELQPELNTALNCMAGIYRFFGDGLKANYLLTQADAAPTNVIKIHGSVIANELHLKSLIQEPVLNEISKAAADGKWFNKKITGEYGVAGYINEKYLTSILGEELATPENIEIVLTLCFEAINLGIMNSEQKNPLCSAIFAQQYPEIMQATLKMHPEYFVDGYILKTTLLNAHEYTPVLLGYSVTENTDYNQAFETAIMPFIEARLQASVFIPIATIIKKGEWSQTIEKQLLGYFDEEYLTTSVLGNSHLGHNLHAVSDVISIIKILGFKVINTAIVEMESTN